MREFVKFLLINFGVRGIKFKVSFRLNQLCNLGTHYFNIEYC